MKVKELDLFEGMFPMEMKRAVFTKSERFIFIDTEDSLNKRNKHFLICESSNLPHRIPMIFSDGNAMNFQRYDSTKRGITIEEYLYFSRSIKNKKHVFNKKKMSYVNRENPKSETEKP